MCGSFSSDTDRGGTLGSCVLVVVKCFSQYLSGSCWVRALYAIEYSCLRLAFQDWTCVIKKRTDSSRLVFQFFSIGGLPINF